MNKAFEFVALGGVCVSVQAGRFVRSSFVRRVADMHEEERRTAEYPLWDGLGFGMEPIDTDEWEPVSFEVALFVRAPGRVGLMSGGRGMASQPFWAELMTGDAAPDFGEDGIANFMPLANVDAMLACIARHDELAAARRAAASRVIQRGWRRAISDPTGLLCRRRLLRELDEMSSSSSKMPVAARA